MRWFQTIAFLFIGALTQTAVAQPQVDSLRAHYIQEFPDRFAVWPVLKYRELSFNLRDKDNGNTRINYKPNNSYTLGVGGYLFDLVVEATFAIPLSEKSREIYGESEVTELQANILAKRFTADVYYQKYRGFYIEDKGSTVPPGIPYPQRPDVGTRNYGVGGLYVFNHRKFSLRSAFNYVDRQLSSRGSVVAGGSLAWSRVEADSAVLSGFSQGAFGDGNAFRELRNTTIAIVAGYSYTLIWKDFFVNGTLVMGPAHNWISYLEDGTSYAKETGSLANNWRIGVGYNGDRIFGGIGYSAQSRRFNFGEIRFTNVSSLLRVVVGYRFQKIGILKKRAIDLVPGGF